MTTIGINVGAELDSLEEPGRGPRSPNNTGIKNYLMRMGFPEPVARPVAMNELCYWTEPEVMRLFDRLHATPADIRRSDRKTFAIEPSAEERTAAAPGANANDGLSDFLKPSWQQVVDSAARLGALCVNRQGEFRVNPPGGYAALSHVWTEGLGGDAQGRGLHRSLIEQVFARVAPLGIEWIWTDSLAIPGAGEELTVEEEEMKACLINAMADIYRNAKEVIVLDSLTMRLASDDAVETAVILCLGSMPHHSRQLARC